MFAVIRDLYFVHERGARVAALTVAILGIANLPALLSGLITDELGWRWNFWMLAIFLGIGLGLVILFAWEPAYNYLPDTPIDDEQSPLLRRLSPFSGSYSELPLVEMVLKPFMILIHPAVLWATILLAIFSGPPYFLDAVHISYMSAGPAIGGILGLIVCGLVSDPLFAALARKNNRIYEPEFCLVLIILMLPPVVIAVIWAIAITSMQFCLSAIGTYILDAYPDGDKEFSLLWAVL
ncbi:hypothetical protein BDV12DRAFT_191565 [Aspergillus spectabilis]